MTTLIAAITIILATPLLISPARKPPQKPKPPADPFTAILTHSGPYAAAYDGDWMRVQNPAGWVEIDTTPNKRTAEQDTEQLRRLNNKTLSDGHGRPVRFEASWAAEDRRAQLASINGLCLGAIPGEHDTVNFNGIPITSNSLLNDGTITAITKDGQRHTSVEGHSSIRTLA